MIEWFGGVSNVVTLAIALFASGLLLLLTKIAETNRSRRYIVPAICCWAGFLLVIAFEEGTLVPVPRLVGIGIAVVLLIGFLLLMFRGLYEIWKL